MATRIKTVEYAFDANRSNLAAATRLDLSAINLHLEKQSRSFVSAVVQVGIDSNDATAVSLTSYLIGIKLGSASFSDATVTNTTTNSGQPQTRRMIRDVTSYFTSNYGSACLQTCQVGLQFGAIASINHSVKLIITYEFDDTELLDSGTATSGASTTLTDSGKSWTVDDHIDQYVKITGGTGAGQVRIITDNDATSLTVAAWDTNPDSTSTYEILQAKFKTVRIPIESALASLTDTLGEIGTNQVPELDSFLPEANKSYKDIFFEIFGKDNNSGTTDYSLAFALDSESEVASGLYEQALNGSCFRYHTWKRTDMATNAAHAFKARSTITTLFYALGAILNVTYQYLEGESISVMNSLMIPFRVPSIWLMSTTSAERERMTADFVIAEPATITLKQSAVMFGFGHLGATTISFGVGGQTPRSYVFPAGSSEVGQSTLMHRFDSGGAAGAGITLARGQNTLQVDAYVTSSLDGCPSGMFAILNYTSAIASQGAEAHNKTILKFISAGNGMFNRFTIAATSVTIPETSYYLSNLSYLVPSIVNNAGASTRMAQTLRAERLSGGYIEDGWEEIGVTMMLGDSEVGEFWLTYDATRKYRPHPTHPDGDFYWANPTSSRRHIVEAPTSCHPFTMYAYTYHSITYTVSGQVRGYTGDGSGITVEIFKVDTDEKVGSVTTTAGGYYTFTWYDNVDTVYASAWQDSTHMGRSGSGIAT